MHSHVDKHCQVCGNKFSINDLYPTSLIRSAVIKSVAKKYPDVNDQGFVCFPDLRKINGLYYEEILEKEKGSLSKLEKEVITSLKQHDILAENINDQYEEKTTFGERIADKVAKFGGSWSFIIFFASILLFWISFNTFTYFEGTFDPYPYILLNLVLSSLAAFQAPIIMMSQNRQAAKDRLTQEHDYLVNLKAEPQIRQVNARLELFMKHHWQKAHELECALEEILEELEQKSRLEER